MSPLEIAHKYMDCFYGKEPLEEMRALLAQDLHFEGPLYRFVTGGDYYQSLQDNPPENVNYEILNEYESENSACLVYLFRKPGVETLMAQTLEVENNKICQIRLIFDTSMFV